jgi:hypothetical protein
MSSLIEEVFPASTRVDIEQVLALLEFVRESGKYNMFMEFGAAVKHAKTLAMKHNIAAGFMNAGYFSNVKGLWNIYSNAYEISGHREKMQKIIDGWNLLT